MRHHTRSKRSRWIARSAAVVGFAALLLVIAGQPTHAHGKKHHRKAHVVYVPRYAHDHVHAQKVFTVPQRIHRRVRSTYRPYYEGTRWYRPHRHAHAVYYFPVLTPHGYAYRPHYYCEGRLYRGGYVTYSGPRVRFRIGF